MKVRAAFSYLSLLVTALALSPLFTQAAGSKGPDREAVPAVTMTVTANVADGKRMPEIKAEDLVVKRGADRLRVTGFTPAQGEYAGLDLFILIDDASDTSLGTQLDALRNFIKSQPSTTAIGIGYMRNTTVQIVQNFTTDHETAASKLRLPLGSPGAFSSPYLSAMNLMKRWPEGSNRREILMITDGVDRARGGPRWRGLSINPDVDSASRMAQRTGTIIHSIYTPGIGRWHRNFWEATNGQLGISKLADETGGEAFYLGLQQPVSFGPYLEQLQRILNNQYLLHLAANPDKKAGPQYVSLSTEIAGVDIAAADSVWVGAAAR